MFERWWTVEFTVSKQLLGLLMIIAGVVLAVGMIAIELVSTSAGFGAIQQFGVFGGVLSVLLGCTLLPLGDQPA